MLDFVIFAGTVVLFLIIAIFVLYPGSKRTTTIPGPEISDPQEGNFPDIAACGSLHEFLVDLHDTYGPIAGFWFGPQFTVSIATPELFKQHSAAFDRPKALFELFEPLISSASIQFINGPDGRNRHTAYSRSYSHENINKYFEAVMTLSTETCSRLAKSSAEDHLPLTDVMFHFAIKAVLKTSFGFVDDKKVTEFKHSYDYTWNLMENRLKENYEDVHSQDLFEKEKKTMYAILKEAAEAAKNNASGKGYRLVDILNDLDVSPSIREADMMTFCIASFHTTALLLSWAIYYLAYYPEIQEKLYEEVMTALGDEDLQFEDIPKLTYVKQVIDETLRCSTLAPYAARVQDFDIELGGHKIPAGTPVIEALGVELQDPEIWPDPDKFDPDRFSDGKSIAPYSFEPFGFAGKRKCPGYRFAYMETTVMLCNIVRQLKVSLVPDQVVLKDYGLVCRPKEEIWITVIQRDK